MSASEPGPTGGERLQALLLALCCAVLFLRDGLVPGRALVPYPPEAQLDLVRAEAIAAGTFDPVDARRGNTSGGDKYLQSLCWDRVMHDRLRAGELPLWTRDIAAGAPFVPQMAQVYEPINLLLLLLPSTEWYGPWFLLHELLFGYLCYLFLRRLGCGHGAALLGVVTACLGLWTQCKVHHNVILTAALPLWPMLSMTWDLAGPSAAGRAVDRARRRRKVAWLALWTGVSWLSGFAVVSLQVSYLTVGFALLCSLRRPRCERLAALLPVGIGMLLGGLLSFAHMIPVLQASAVSARDAGWNPEFLAAHGLEWDHALTALWPDLLSWPSEPAYPTADPLVDATRMPWAQLVLLASPRSPVTQGAFQSWVETAFAVGTIPLALATVALLERARRPLALFFAAAGALAFGFALADEPLLSLARFVPGIGQADLRRLLFTVAMALVVLSSLGADALRRGRARWPAFTVLGVAALAATVALLWFQTGDEHAFARTTAELIAADRDHPDVRAAGGSAELIAANIERVMAPGELDHNRSALLATALRSLLAGGAGIALLLFAVRRPRVFAAGAVVATMLELLHAGLGFVQTVPAERVSTPPKIFAPLLEAATPNGVRPRLARLAGEHEGRKMAWYPGNLPGALGIEDATGYNPLPAARFEEFFEAIEPDRAGKVDVAYHGAGVGAFHDPASLTHPLCDLFGIRYVLTKLDHTEPGTVPFQLLERTTTLPRATFVRRIDVLPDAAERLAALRDPTRDVAHRVILEDERAVKPSPNEVPPATVEITSHADERVAITVDSEGDGYLRLADPYDRGWRATIDGFDTEVFAADHYLRAVYLRRGRHEVVFRYDAGRVLWPRHLSFVVLLTLVGLALSGLRRTVDGSTGT
ncbi:MAG: YfhO family protein [Planctomycetes bacterium]|nr:YfhO family protein [Planctomycetota bacterium]